MVQNVRPGFDLHGDKKAFFINMVIIHRTLKRIYMQFEYQHSRSCNVSVEHVQLLRGINRVAKKMRTDFEMGTDGHRFLFFQFGIS